MGTMMYIERDLGVIPNSHKIASAFKDQAVTRHG